MLRPAWAIRAVAILGVVAAVATAVPVTPARAAGDTTYAPPVEARVTEPFRAPTTPYGPGHRGLGYRLAPGTPVRAAADGVVTFAGPVAGSLHVTVRHPDGVRTTASFVRSIEVAAGQRVRRGQVIARSGPMLHFGARLGDHYFDPASLFDGRVQVRLVPFEDPPGEGEDGERNAIAGFFGGVADMVGRAAGAAGRAVGSAAGATGRALADGTGRAVRWLRDDGARLVDAVVEHTEAFASLLSRRVRFALTLAEVVTEFADAAHDIWAVATRECTTDGVAVAPPPERRVAVVVAGLGSDSEDAGIDDLGTSELGYAPGDVVRFSYRGGRAPDPTDRIARRAPERAYAGEHTQEGVMAHGRRLADLIEAAVADAEGAPVDVYAHSLGGLVTRAALLELEARHGTAWLERIGLVSTLGTPHEGSDLAAAVLEMKGTNLGDRLLERLRERLGFQIDLDSPVLVDLAAGSELVGHLAREGVPDGVRLLSVGAREDVVVAAHRTRVEGATNVTVDTGGVWAHESVVDDPVTQRELLLALRGLAPRCVGLATVLADEAVGRGVSAATRLVGDALVTAAGG